MDDKLVYRSLRQLSAWALDGFYSDVHVSGQENVPASGPVVLLPCHHNEILDIAALSVSIPHGRPISFWAKASMFSNPLARAVMTSAGSIPVQRSPHNAGAADANKDRDTDADRPPDARFALLRETFRALDTGAAVGVFPEGTSYTAPRVAQVKEGAAWVALEYARWQLQHVGADAEGKLQKLALVPVGIVYSDKTRFQSRVFVRFGEPIELEQYTRRHLASADPRVEVQNLTREIEARLFKLTVNAATWDQLFAGAIARDIANGSVDQVDPDAFVRQSQRFMNRLASQDSTETMDDLVQYSGLQHRTGISHEIMATLYPKGDHPTRFQSLTVFIRQLARSIAHPLSLAFIPVGLVHLPAYLAGSLAGRYLANAKEPETVAERKAVCGGVAFFATSVFIGKQVHTFLSGVDTTAMLLGGIEWLLNQSTATNLLSLLNRTDTTTMMQGASTATTVLSHAPTLQIASSLCKLVGITTAIYCTTRMLFHWHRALVPWNYKQLQCTSAAWTVFTATWMPPSATLTPAQFATIRRPPIPAPNPFIKTQYVEHVEPTLEPSTAPPARFLVGPLFAARARAEAAARRVSGGA